MNYEELLVARSDGKLNKSQLPIGEYYRRQTDGKYRGCVDIRSEMNESIVFSEALKNECERNKTLMDSHQLHFEPVVEGGEVRRLELEQGVYLSFEQLLDEQPAVVAERDFLDRTLSALVDAATYLHQQGIMHVCFSPKTVFVRKGDHAVFLLSHGSFYLALSNQEEFYGDDVRYVAPEVLSHGTVDERCDVFSIGRFMEMLYEHSSMPMAYRKVIKRATSEHPEDRYATPADMMKAGQKRRSTIRSVMSLTVALGIALLCLALYFDMVPQTTQVEFVKPVPRQATDDLIDDGFSPEDLGVTNADSLTEEDRQTEREYQAKAEEIFRKRYEQEADRILSKIYNTEYMSNSEKQFRAQSQSTLEELMKLQQQLGAEASLTPERAQLIAAEIIDRITEKKKKEWGGTNSRAIQK